MTILGTSLGKSGQGLDWGRAQGQENPGKWLGNLKESLLFPQTQENIWKLDKEPGEHSLESASALLSLGHLLFTFYSSKL